LRLQGSDRGLLRDRWYGWWLEILNIESVLLRWQPKASLLGLLIAGLLRLLEAGLLRLLEV
jgi:hypothetical protein